MEADKFYYGVRIVTGTVKGAGTDAAVFVTLIGQKAATSDLHLLDGTESLKGISSSTFLDLIIKTDTDLDGIDVILLGNTGCGMQLGGNWFVDFTMTYNISTTEERMFPSYHWIVSKSVVSTTSQTATLSDIKDNKVLVTERTNQIKERQKEYKWATFPDSGIPSGIDENVFKLPADERFDRVKNIDFTSNGLHAIITLGLEGLVLSVDDLEDYVTIARSLEKDENLSLYQGSRWVSDVEFGRQMLNGINPVIIQKCTDIPKKFPVTDEMVGRFLTREKTLEEEMKDGNVYICDMEIMDGLTPRKGYFAPAPICLLYVNSSDELVPIAIQIKQGVREEEQKEPNPIFFPSDHWIDWVLAKIYYQASCSQFHQLSTHYFSCHAAMEAYAMGTMRNLPDAHPINKLLCPHFRYTMAINTRARATLINKGGIIDLSFGIGGEGVQELYKKVSKEYSVDWTNIKKNLAKRGMDVPNQPPRYHWRDDGVKVWDALEEFVTNVIGEFYPTDDDVKNDTELNNWAEDLVETGFSPGKTEGSEGHGFPKTIATKELLIEQCTRIMFTGSAQHSSINFLQNFIYGFVPNAPFGVRRPPPIVKGQADNQTLFNTLPDKTSAALDLVLTYTLSQYSPDDVYLGNYPDERFTENNIQDYITKTSAKMSGIAEEIKTRNADLDVPYPYMCPTSITNSITN